MAFSPILSWLGLLLTSLVRQKEHRLDPRDRVYAQKYHLQEYKDALKYVSVGTMMCVVAGVAAIVLGSSSSMHLAASSKSPSIF